MWNKINVFQYQQMLPVLKIKDSIEQDGKLISILYNITENEVDNLSVIEYFKYKNSLEFLNKEISGKPVKYIKVKGKRYRCIYDVRNMPSGRYIESKVFSKDFANNLHKISASMVIPQKRNFFGIWKDDKWDASKHEDYANDLLEANFSQVYHSIVFFYHVYRNWMEVSKDYLIQKMIQAGMNHSEAKKEILNLLNILDGNIVPKLLPTMKISKLAKRMNSQRQTI
jgi:hypothetical protein